MADDEKLLRRVEDLEKQIDLLTGENKSLTKRLSEKTQDVTEKRTYEFTSQLDAMVNVGKATTSAAEAILDGAKQFGAGIDLLEEKGVELQNSFGVSRQRMEEFKTLIADVAPRLAAMNVSEDEFAQTVIGVTSQLGGVATLTADAIVDIKAASKLTNVEVGDLAKNFRAVGISMYDVGEKMKDVADYAKKVGVPVSAVAEGVVNNLGKMNLFNFDNGVDGLTKMAAQSARLGVSMETVFTLAEDLFSPEKAIQYSAALQRLGVTSNGLLDPLRSMDMAQNDPEALQNELVNLTKDFVRFSEENNKFEIMPGSQRRLREIANELNIPAKELAQMGIQAAEFDRKLAQVKLPSFTGADDKETKELIASMSQIKDGIATVTVKNIQTGEVKLKQTDQLTPEDIESLKYQEEESSKTIEELAIEQLNQLKAMNSQLSSLRYGGMMTAASTGTIQRFGETGARAMRGGIRALSSEATSETTRKIISPTIRSVEDGIIAAMKGDTGALDRAYGDFEKSLTHVSTEVSGLANRILTKFEEALKNAPKPYDPVLQRMEQKSQVNVDIQMTLNTPQNLNLTKSDAQAIVTEALSSSKMKNQIINELGNKPLSMEPKKPG